MSTVNKVVRIGTPATEEVSRLRVTMDEIISAKKELIERNLSFSPEEFATLFGKKPDWALAKMRDGSVKVLDEHAKVGKDGIKFSKYARIEARSVDEFRSSIIVPNEISPSGGG